MTKTPRNEVEEDDLPTVEELEAELKKHPKDADLQEELADSLMNRHVWGDEGYSAGADKDLKRIRGLLARMPATRALRPRAYISLMDGDKKNFVRFAEAWAKRWIHKDDEPLDADLTFMFFDLTFPEPPTAIYPKWAAIMEEAWPEAAVSHYMRGMALWLHEKDQEKALDALTLSLEKESDFWPAAMCCGQIYEVQENWRTAYGYYNKALSHEYPAKALPNLHWGAAVCCNRLKNHAGVEQHASDYLKMVSDDYELLGPLGWAMMKQGKYTEALKVFENQIRLGEDGVHAVRNRAEALAKLGRIQEAIETWKSSSFRGQLPKYVKDKIAQHEEILVRQRQGEAIADTLIAEPEDAAEDAEEEIPLVVTEKTRKAERITVKTEQMLEEMVEHLIASGKEVFGKTLRVFNASDGLYGRQYPIPGVGRIDLLAEDVSTGDLVVIELKRDETDDQVIGQISRYVSWVREHLAPKGKNVNGVICVKQATRKLMLAVRNIAGVEVYEYDLSFRSVAR